MNNEKKREMNNEWREEEEIPKETNTFRECPEPPRQVELGHTLCLKLPGGQGKDGNTLTMMPFASRHFSHVSQVRPQQSGQEAGFTAENPEAHPRSPAGQQQSPGRHSAQPAASPPAAASMGVCTATGSKRCHVGPFQRRLGNLVLKAGREGVHPAQGDTPGPARCPLHRGQRWEQPQGAPPGLITDGCWPERLPPVTTVTKA